MLPSDDLIDWMFSAYEWLLKSFDGFGQFEETRLVLPTKEFFPTVEASGHELAEAIFLNVRKYAGMDEWPCRLEMHEDPDISKVLDGIPHESKGGTAAAGTISVQGDDRVVTITYSQSQLKKPMSMVATFAHELSHYLLFTAETDAPGGPEAEEFATDVGAVFLGYGVFSANAAFEFEGFQEGLMEGWRSSRLGYLGEVELAYALAIFCCLLDIPYKVPKPHLDLNPRTYLKKAMKHVAKRRLADVERLRSITRR